MLYGPAISQSDCKKASPYQLPIIMNIIKWHSISMGARPAVLRFDWSKAGLSMDLPVFIYSHMKTGLKISFKCETNTVIFKRFVNFKPPRYSLVLFWFVFCLDPSLSRSVDHPGLLIVIWIRCLLVSILSRVGLLAIRRT